MARRAKTRKRFRRVQRDFRKDIAFKKRVKDSRDFAVKVLRGMSR
jgi:hypothetical protein